MNNHEIAERLKKLVRMNIETMWNYDRVIDEIQGDEELREQLTLFRSEFFEHFQNLSEYISQLGEEPPKIEDSFEPTLPENLTVWKGTYEKEKVLKSLVNDERAIQQESQDSADQIMVPEIVSELEDEILDEQDHIQTFESMLSR